MMSSRALSLLLLCVLLGTDLGAQKAGEEARPGVIAYNGVVTSRGQRPFGFFPPVKCDGEGNIYFRVGGPGNYDRTPVWKFSNKAEKKAEFVLPPGDPGSMITEFVVGDGGDVSLIVTDERMYKLLSFDKDGVFHSTTKLALPARVRVDHAAKFRNGDLLVVGHYQESDTDSLSNHPYAAVLSGNGELRKLISTLQPDGTREDPFPGNQVILGYVVPAPDGNIYNLRRSRILVISPSGDVVRTIPIKTPAEGFDGAKLTISGHLISVEFNRSELAKMVEIMFQTYDMDGNLLGTYVPVPELGNSPLCFDLDDGYSFSSNQDGMLAFKKGKIQ